MLGRRRELECRIVGEQAKVIPFGQRWIFAAFTPVLIPCHSDSRVALMRKITVPTTMIPVLIQSKDR